MNDLIERLEKATEPSRELDRAIWLAVGGTIKSHAWAPGHHVETWIDWTGNKIARPDDSRWTQLTSSIDAAMTLLPDDDTRYLALQRDIDEFGNQWHVTYRRLFFGHANTLAIALCIAALKARAARP